MFPMKKALLSIFTIITTSLFADVGDTYYIKKVTTAPTIDGNITEWDGVPSVPFTVHTDGSVGSTSGTAQVVWDDDAVYFAFSISDTDVKSNYTDQDDNLFNNDDLVEIFLDFDGDGRNYLELGVSAANVNYDMMVCPAVTCGSWGTNSAWDITGLETATTIVGTINNSADVDEGYIIEVKIPFTGLSSAPSAGFENPDVGTVWKGNLYTIDYNTDAGIDAANDYLSWSSLSSFGFHQPSEFASFEFADGGSVVNSISSTDSFKNINGNVWSLSVEGITSLFVYDLTGKLVTNTSVLQFGTIDLEAFQPGIYIVKMINSGVDETRKIMVK